MINEQNLLYLLAMFYCIAGWRDSDGSAFLPVKVFSKQRQKINNVSQTLDMDIAMSHYDEYLDKYEMASNDLTPWELEPQDKQRGKRAKQRRRQQSEQQKRHGKSDDYREEQWR